VLRGDDDSEVEEGVGEDPVGEMRGEESCSTDETAAVEVDDGGSRVVAREERWDEDVHGYLDIVYFFVVG